MIYQILFVFALLIVALNDASGSDDGDLTKEKFDAMYKDYKEKIEWSWIFGKTKEVPSGVYAVYKKSGDKYVLVHERDRKEGGKRIDLYKWDDDFSITETYIIVGKELKFENGKLTNGEATNVKSKEQRWLTYAIVSIVIASVTFAGCCVFACCCYFKKSK